MFRPVSLFIGLRYTRAKRRDHFISVISLFSILCFALGVMTLIAVLSVMNGFDEQIRERVFSMAPQVTVSNYNNALSDWESVQQKIAAMPDVEATAPYVIGQGMLTNYGQTHPAMLFGISPEQEATVSDVSDSMIEGSLDALQPGKFGIVLGQGLAQSLGAMLGDKVTLLTPSASLTPAGVVPRFKRFTVVGIFKMGNGFGFDKNYAFIDMRDARVLYRLGDDVSGIRLKLNDLYQAPGFAQRLRENMGPAYLISNWTEDYGAFFQAVALEKTMMFFVLMMIIIVAAFSLVSTLFMTVSDKQSDIAILRTMGMTPREVLGVFLVQGIVIGLIGTLLGVIGGVVLALNLTSLANWLQDYFQVQLLSSNVYYVDFLPSKIIGSDIVKVCLSAFIVGLIAALLPAWKASRVQPAEALRYE